MSELLNWMKAVYTKAKKNEFEWKLWRNGADI